MSSKSPLFTVVAVCCNVADYVEEMILSIKNQTFADFECLAVVEDSSDKTEEIVRSAVAGDKRFSVITLPRSGSASVPRNYGIKHGKGKYLVFVDGDDWIELNALEKFAAIINKTPDLDI
ncbi:MAG: glycosyltransferase family 2 protein, partial [Victivallales bacterium]|nr:glycosyltransferase family 2 protein [Victivallales bacterium]